MNSTCSNKYLKWTRFEGKFPDLQLMCSDGVPSGCGIEVKVICASCEEPSARFWHAVSNFSDYDSQYVAVLAWKLSDINHGYPQITNTVCINAKQLAEDRDKTTHQPPKRLVSQPKLSKDHLKYNTKQTDIKVLIFQENDKRYNEALEMYTNFKNEENVVECLTSKFKYREDSNAGKLNRIKNEALVSFIKSIK